MRLKRERGTESELRLRTCTFVGARTHVRTVIWEAILKNLGGGNSENGFNYNTVRVSSTPAECECAANNLTSRAPSRRERERERESEREREREREERSRT